MTIGQFAFVTGLPEKQILEYCRNDRIFGARKHPITKKWWIYPPAKLLCQPRNQKRGSTSTQMTSTSLDVEQA